MVISFSRVPDENQVAYQEQLKQMAELLKKGDVPNEEVVKVLGNNVLALYSVPTAIYSFLRAQEVVPFIQVSV